MSSTNLLHLMRRGPQTFSPLTARLKTRSGLCRYRGTQAIIAYLQTFPTVLNEIRIQSFDVTVAGQEAAIKWRLRFKTKTGNVFFVDGGLVVENTPKALANFSPGFELARTLGQFIKFAQP